MSATTKYSNYSQFQQCNSKLNKMIQFDNSGTVGQIIGSDGSNGLVWVDSDPSSAATWSEYPATQTVDISGNDIDDIDNLTANKIKIGELSYQSAFPIGIEVAFDENTFTTGLLAQNKDSANTSSVSILLTNDIGTDSAYYGGLTMFSSNTIPQYGFPSIKNAIVLNSQSSSVVVSAWNGQQDGTANENGNIMLTYNGGSKAHIINNNGQLIIGADNPDYSGNTYGGDTGGTDNVLTSNGTNGLKWVSPEYAPLWSQFPATQTIDASGNDISDVKDIGITGTISNNTKLSLNFDVNNPTISMINDNANMTIQDGNLNFVNVATGNQLNMFGGNVIGLNDSTGTYRTSLLPPIASNYNTIIQGAGVNSVIYLRVSDNNPTIQLSNTVETTYSRSDLTSLYYNNGTIETAKLDSTAKTLTLNDGTNTSVLSTTGLTFSGVPYSRNMVNSSLIYSSAAIYADSTYPPATNLLIRNTYSYSGWAFVNTDPNSKFNYYFAPQSPTTQVQDIKGISFNYFNVTQTSNDAQIFCTIYTKPQVGDPTFYHSKRNYIFDQTITPTINTSYQACVLVDKSLISYYYETQIQYELDPLNQVGPFLPSEEVLSVTLSSSSSTPAGTMSVVLQKLNIIMDGFTKEFLLVSP